MAAAGGRERGVGDHERWRTGENRETADDLDRGSPVRPDWWPYPERCANGHEWGPHRVLVVWRACHCPGAQTLHEDRVIWGHFTVTCREAGCESVWYDPPHEPC